MLQLFGDRRRERIGHCWATRIGLYSTTRNRLVCNLLSSPCKNSKKEVIQMDDFFFGDPERTRTVDLQRDRLAC